MVGSESGLKAKTIVNQGGPLRDDMKSAEEIFFEITYPKDVSYAYLGYSSKFGSSFVSN
jgi:hypothetical protein